MKIDVDALAQEIRRVDGSHSLGAGALAEALMPFFTAALAEQTQQGVEGYSHEDRVALAGCLSWDLNEISPEDVKGILERLRAEGYSLTRSALVDVPAVESEPTVWQHRLRAKPHKNAPWTEWRDGKANLSPVARAGLYVEERPLYASPVRSAIAPAPAEVVEKATANGMAIAAGIVMRCWGNETYAREILGAAGLTSLENLVAAGVDQYDIDALSPALSPSLVHAEDGMAHGSRSP